MILGKEVQHPKTWVDGDGEGEGGNDDDHGGFIFALINAALFVYVLNNL